LIRRRADGRGFSEAYRARPWAQRRKASMCSGMRRLKGTVSAIARLLGDFEEAGCHTLNRE
jgi:hypothetical protein